jgi:hypothetical protein
MHAPPDPSSEGCWHAQVLAQSLLGVRRLLPSLHPAASGDTALNRAAGGEEASAAATGPGPMQGRLLSRLRRVPAPARGRGPTPAAAHPMGDEQSPQRGRDCTQNAPGVRAPRRVHAPVALPPCTQAWARPADPRPHQSRPPRHAVAGPMGHQERPRRQGPPAGGEVRRLAQPHRPVQGGRGRAGSRARSKSPCGVRGRTASRLQAPRSARCRAPAASGPADIRESPLRHPEFRCGSA